MVCLSQLALRPGPLSNNPTSQGNNLAFLGATWLKFPTKKLSKGLGFFPDWSRPAFFGTSSEDFLVFPRPGPLGRPSPARPHFRGLAPGLR